MSLEKELEELAVFSEVPGPAVTRIVFSREDMQARAWLKRKMIDAGLSVREDAIGNTFGRWPGKEPDLPAVATGSHIDAIPNAGRFDGTVGVLGGLEAIRQLKAGGIRPRRSIDLILFTSEEPTRFGIGCLGSRLLSGALPADKASRMPSLEDLRTSAGFTGSLSSVQLKPDHYASFVELHIEQGTLLEAEGINIGVVTDIAAPAGLRMTISGQGGHAGTVLMRARKDALVGAAEMITMIERVALQTGSVNSVATTGVCQVFPGAVNSVPSQVTLEIDVRDTDQDVRDEVIRTITQECQSIAGTRGLYVAIEILNRDAPAQCDAAIVSLIFQACEEMSFSCRRMISRAYHDTLFMAQLAPVSMIFIPSRDGISHRPDEFSSMEDISRGVAVLAKTLAALAG